MSTSKIKVGDIVADRRGYFKITAVKPRWVKIGGVTKWDYVDETADPALRGEEGSPIVVMLKIAKPDGTPIKGKVPTSCDASYCQLATQLIPKRLDSLDKEKELLMDILKRVI